MYRLLILALLGCGPTADKSRTAVEQGKAAANPTDPAAQFRLGVTALSERKNEAAEAAFTECLKLDPNRADALDRRGDARLRLGKFQDAVDDFDAYLKLKPKDGPQHWRRGIALYYAGKYAEGAKQFESHKEVNPEDVENAAWHFLCVARDKGIEAARKGLIPVKKDVRVPMAEVQKLFAGTATPDDVLSATGKIPAKTAEGIAARFYANLYVGLYYEATGATKKAKEHITTAAEKYENDGYMWDVAAAHAKTFK
jgi:lipoprotein NlpI